MFSVHYSGCNISEESFFFLLKDCPHQILTNFFFFHRFLRYESFILPDCPLLGSSISCSKTWSKFRCALAPVEGNTQFREKVTRMAVGDEETLLGFTQVDARLSHLWMSVQRTDLSSLMLPLIPTPGFPFECSCEVNLFWRWDSST